MGNGEFCLFDRLVKFRHKRRECRKCKLIYQRRWRKTAKGRAYEKKYQASIRWTPLYWAKAEVYKAVRKGLMRPAKEFYCLDCGDPARVYDHRDYSKPLIVEPVCSSCNARRGRAL